MASCSLSARGLSVCLIMPQTHTTECEGKADKFLTTVETKRKLHEVLQYQQPTPMQFFAGVTQRGHLPEHMRGVKHAQILRLLNHYSGASYHLVVIIAYH